MLVLSRKTGEGITVDEQIKIYVIEIKGSRVRLAIDAPLDVAVHRNEVHQSIQSNPQPNRFPVADRQAE